jgi:hypothetical protein
MHKNQRENAQDEKKNKEKEKSDVRSQGESDLTLHGSPSRRNINDVRT